MFLKEFFAALLAMHAQLVLRVNFNELFIHDGAMEADGVLVLWLSNRLVRKIAIVDEFAILQVAGVDYLLFLFLTINLLRYVFFFHFRLLLLRFGFLLK